MSVDSGSLSLSPYPTWRQLDSDALNTKRASPLYTAVQAEQCTMRMPFTQPGVNICCESHRCGQTWLVSQSQVYTSLASVTWADLTFLNLQNVMILWGALNEDFTDYHIYWILYSPKSYSSTLSHVSINFKITLWIRYYLLFTDEETGTERLNDLCKAIQLLQCRKRNQIQAVDSLAQF